MLYSYLREDNKVSDYTDYIVEFCQNMKLTEDTINRVTEVANRANYLGILENNKPTSIVADCIHYVSSDSGLNINPNDISRQCNK